MTCAMPTTKTVCYVADNEYMNSLTSGFRELEEKLFSEIFRRKLHDQGYLTKQELRDIIQWKMSDSRFAPVILNKADCDTEEFVRLVTRQAFAATDPRIAAHILCALRGVGVRMASAILTVYEPTVYTVMDIRA